MTDTKTEAELRSVFESVVKSTPFECSTARHTEKSAWPGNYKDYVVDFAWAVLKEVDEKKDSMRDEKSKRQKEAFYKRMSVELFEQLRDAMFCNFGGVIQEHQKDAAFQSLAERFGPICEAIERAKEAKYD